MLVALSDSRRALEDRLHLHQLGSLDPAVGLHRLRSLAAILRTPAGLDRQQRAELDLLGRMKLAVDGGCTEQEFSEGKVEQPRDFLTGPVCADLGQFGDHFLRVLKNQMSVVTQASAATPTTIPLPPHQLRRHAK